MKSYHSGEIACKIDSLTIDYNNLVWFAYEWLQSFGAEAPKELEHLSTCLAMFSDKLQGLSQDAYKVARG